MNYSLSIPAHYRRFLFPFLFALGYGVLFYGLQFFLVKSRVFAVMPQSSNILSWDAAFYDRIRQHGYQPGDDSGGFFFLFPLVWRISMLNVWGIVGLNIVFFAAGFSLLTNLLRERDKQFWLLWLTLPSVYFVFVPYTEALFFLLGVSLLYTLQLQRYKLLALLLVLITITRAGGLLLLPALFVMEIARRPRREWWYSVRLALLRYALPGLIGLSIFVGIQFYQTGVWFYYFKVQSTVWYHVYSFPRLPFNNIEQGDWRYHWLNAIAILAAAASFAWLLMQAWRWGRQKPSASPLMLVSCGYLVVAGLILLFANPKFGGTGTNIMGAHRYIVSSPFSFIFLHHFARRTWKISHIAGFLALLQIFWAMFGAYAGPGSFLVTAMPGNMLILAFMLYTGKRQAVWLPTFIVAFNMMVQLCLFQQFITPLYMD